MAFILTFVPIFLIFALDYFEGRVSVGVLTAGQLVLALIAINFYPILFKEIFHKLPPDKKEKARKSGPFFNQKILVGTWIFMLVIAVLALITDIYRLSTGIVTFFRIFVSPTLIFLFMLYKQRQTVKELNQA